VASPLDHPSTAPGHGCFPPTSQPPFRPPRSTFAAIWDAYAASGATGLEQATSHHPVLPMCNPHRVGLSGPLQPGFGALRACVGVIPIGHPSVATLAQPRGKPLPPNACRFRITEVTDELAQADVKEFENRNWPCQRAGVDGLEAKVGRGWEGQPVLPPPQAQRPGPPLWWGANAFSGSRQCEGATPPAPGGGHHLQLRPAAQPWDTSFTGKDLAALDPAAGNFSGFRSSWRPDPTGAPSAGLEVAFQEGLRPNSVGIGQALLPDTTRRRASPPPLRPAFGQEDNARPLGPAVLSADTVLNAAHLNGAPVAYNKKPRFRAGPLVQFSNGFQCQRQLRGGQRQNLGQSSEGGKSAPTASAGTGTVQIGYGARAGASPPIYSYLQARRRVCLGPRLHRSSPGWRPPPRSHNAVGLSGYWQPANSGWISSDQRWLGDQHHLLTTAIRVMVAFGPPVQSWMVGLAVEAMPSLRAMPSAWPLGQNRFLPPPCRAARPPTTAIRLGVGGQGSSHRQTFR